jgi:hypothetical protein
VSPQHAITTSGKIVGSLSEDAHSQIPAPRVQWMTASSIDSHCACGCLPATITFTYCLDRRQWSATESSVFASGGR